VAKSPKNLAGRDESGREASQGRARADSIARAKGVNCEIPKEPHKRELRSRGKATRHNLTKSNTAPAGTRRTQLFAGTYPTGTFRKKGERGAGEKKGDSIENGFFLDASDRRDGREVDVDTPADHKKNGGLGEKRVGRRGGEYLHLIEKRAAKLARIIEKIVGKSPVSGGKISPRG